MKVTMRTIMCIISFFLISECFFFGYGKTMGEDKKEDTNETICKTLVFSADTSAMDAEIEKAKNNDDEATALELKSKKDAMLDETISVLKNRLSDFVGDDTIQIIDGEIHVGLNARGTENQDKIIKAIERQGIVEFRLVNEDENVIKDFEKNKKKYEAKGWILCETDREQLLLEPVVDDMKMLVREIAFVKPMKNSFDEPIVGLSFTKKGAKIMEQFTKKYAETPEHSGRRLAILFDGKVKSAPVLKAVISNACVIDGRFTKQEQSALIEVLKSGALPCKLKFEKEIVPNGEK